MNMVLHYINLLSDALALCYGWLPHRTPTDCACGTSFSVEHAFSCPKGGLPSIWHNGIRDLTATLLTKVFSQVTTEPELQPVSQEDFSLSTANLQDGAKLDIAVNRFWGGRSECVFVDVCIFSQYAPSNPASSLPICYKRSMKTRRREYMDKRFEKLNMLHLLLWLSWLPVDWLMRQHIFINILLPCGLISGMMSILLSWVGCGVPCHFLCYIQQFTVFVGLVPWFYTMLWLLHQWI